MVRPEGVEPSIPYGQLILSQLRMPFRHDRITLLIYTVLLKSQLLYS